VCTDTHTPSLLAEGSLPCSQQPSAQQHSLFLHLTAPSHVGLRHPSGLSFLFRVFKTKCFGYYVPRNSANCTGQFLYRSRTAKVRGQLQRTAAHSAQVATTHQHRYADVMQLRSHLQVQYANRPAAGQIKY
jgi:hypothetical protein